MQGPDGVALLPDSPAELDRYYGQPPAGVRANMVLTPDGAGAFHGRTRAISNDADQALLGYLRGLADAVLVGSATVQAEHYGVVKYREETLARRKAAGFAPSAPLVVVTARASLPASLPIFDPDGPRTIVATLAEAAAKADELREVADVIVAGEETIDLSRVLAELSARGLARVLCEGGPFLLSQLIDQDLVDDMCLTLSPYLAGSQPTTMQPGSDLATPTHLALRHVLTRDDMLYLRYTRD